MRTSRLLIALVAVVAFLGSGCSDDGSDQASDSSTTASTAPEGPQTYTVIVDGPSTLGAENFVLGTYFPEVLAVRPGDAVTFDNRSSNDIHTVTFGVKSDRSDQPPVVTRSGQENPVVFGKCFTSEPVRRDLAACPAPTTGTPEYDGTGFWNSGVILPTALPPEAGPKTVSVKFAPDIAPGKYLVTCLLHPPMESTLQVVASDAERRAPAEVVAAAERELGQAKAVFAGLKPPESTATAAGITVTASWGNETAVVNRFHPETVSVKAGQSITWRSETTWMPHTVSFQPPFATPSEPDALLPAGAKSGSKFDGGVAHSGIFGPPPFYAPETFSLTFTKAGQYPYLCLLHPGMAGTVQVS